MRLQFHHLSKNKRIFYRQLLSTPSVRTTKYLHIAPPPPTHHSTYPIQIGVSPTTQIQGHSLRAILLIPHIQSNQFSTHHFLLLLAALLPYRSLLHFLFLLPLLRLPIELALVELVHETASAIIFIGTGTRPLDKVTFPYFYHTHETGTVRDNSISYVNKLNS